MFPRRAIATAARAARPAIRPQSHIPRAQFSGAVRLQAQEPLEIEDDPNMNGGYINPPAIKREHRSPYGEYTDKQERRDFGEPVHEDNDILGIFSLQDYSHMTPARGALMWAGFIGCVLAVVYGVKATYPDRPSAPKEYEGGLEAEMGGPGAVRAFKAGDKI